MNKQRLKEFALVAEVVSGVAIVVTLAFLAFEMRGNTNAIRAQTYQTLMQQLNDYRMQLVDEKRIAANEKRRENGWNSLTRDEKQRIRIPAMVIWGIYESAYFANERDVLGEPEWRRFEIAICRGYAGNQHYWNPDGFTSMDELLTPQFVEYVHSSCAQARDD
jgi:hypothetical protein